ncbi:MAG: hypothetical protein J1F22_02560 [Lachnospiraceae bacterium]|nr:hypothetical protein [Lachnospiraceae bacterium]
MGERTLLLGYDLCDDKTQLAVYSREKLEPELVGQTDENPDALFDTEIILEDTEVLTGFLPRIRRGEDIIVNGKRSNPVNVLAYYFRKTLSMTRQAYPSETIKQLVITVPEQTPEFTLLIYEALEMLGIGKERARIISHKQSFLYYMLYQKKELWVNDVGMFDYDGEHLHYYQMQVDRRKTPILVGVTEKDFSEGMKATEEEQRKGVIFEDIVYGAIHKQILSALYMTGAGFAEEWSDEVFQKLCVGRRLFKGRNLYVSGACYAAKELGETAKLDDYLLLDEDMISSHISLPIYTDAKEQEVVLVKAGTPWYQINQEWELIPDGENELGLTVKNIFSKEEKNLMVDLEPVSGRVERRCRIRLGIRFEDVHTCTVTIKDMGFGELFPTSNRIWEKTLTVD